jgi:hypothetical protein
MARRPLASRLGRIFWVAVALVMLGGVIHDFLRPDRRLPLYVSVPLAFALVLALAYGGLWAAIVKWRVRRRLAARPPLDAATFGETYFRDLPRGPEVAVAVRRRLEQYMDMDLAGLRPDDRLNDLHAEIDPMFFEGLAKEFGYPPPEDWPEFVARTSSIKTVRDLVEYVAQNAARESV